MWKLAWYEKQNKYTSFYFIIDSIKCKGVSYVYFQNDAMVNLTSYAAKERVFIRVSNVIVKMTVGTCRMKIIVVILLIPRKNNLKLLTTS